MIKTLRFMLVSLLMMLCGTVFAEKVTMKYTGTETANMTGENDAALLGLDASKWSVVAAKEEIRISLALTRLATSVSTTTPMVATPSQYQHWMEPSSTASA